MAQPILIDVLLEEYTGELALRRGLSEHTVTAYVQEARSFLQFLAELSDVSSDEPLDLSDLELTDVRAWLAGA